MFNPQITESLSFVFNSTLQNFAFSLAEPVSESLNINNQNFFWSYLEYQVPRKFKGQVVMYFQPAFIENLCRAIYYNDETLNNKRLYDFIAELTNTFMGEYLVSVKDHKYYELSLPQSGYSNVPHIKEKPKVSLTFADLKKNMARIDLFNS